MAVVRSRRLSLCAPRRERKRVLEALQRAGMVEIIREGEEDSCFSRIDTAAQRSVFERASQTALRAAEVLDAAVPPRQDPLASLRGRHALTADEFSRRGRDADAAIGVADKILELQKREADARARAGRASSGLEALAPWMGLDVPLDYGGTPSAPAWVGSVPGERGVEQLACELREAGASGPFELEVVWSGPEQTCLVAVCGAGSAESFAAALRMVGFARPQLAEGLVPRELAERLSQELEEARGDAGRAAEQIRGLAGERERLRFASDCFRMRADKYAVLGDLLQSGHAFFVEGWVASDRAEALASRLEREYSCAAALSDPEPGDDAPIQLRNGRFFEPTEGVVESYGLPGPGEIDPTAPMSVFYYFLFGLMLADAGYGLLMVLCCGWALARFSDMETGLRKTLRMFFWCGVSTTFWGVMFGGYFGDIPTVFASRYLGASFAIPAVWFAPLGDPMRLLMFSLGVGVVHLFCGLAIKGYELARQRAWLDLFAGVVCWFVLLAALLCMLAPSDIFSSMAGVTVVLPAWAGEAARWSAVAASACIVVFSEHGTKNIAARLALGLYDLYGVSGWLSDVLSYSRLLALGLASGVIGTIINTMAAMLPANVLGDVAFWAIFVFGHLFNMAINLLGAYVHTNRLQFVEFFGKFYEGGGRPLRPFSVAANKFYKFKEEA